MEQAFGIKFKATATGWYYKWAASGMLMRAVNPEMGKVDFGYDPLGRRVWKEVKHQRTCWLWDGNVPLHEWQTTEKEQLIDVITWVFEEGSFVPTARITDRSSQSIVTDYLGTPTQMYDSDGNKTWEAQLDIYSRVRTFAGRSLNECPFRYQGQYQDSETGLYYNRFRYYDPEIGSYISQDPIGLEGGSRLYGYVHDANSWIDEFGLLRRPYIRKSTRIAIEAKARTRGGRFTDANTGLPIKGGKRRPYSRAKGEYHLGHKPGHEHWRLVEKAEAMGMKQKEFNDFVNNPKFFQIEDPHENMSHKHEKPREAVSSHH